MLPSDIANTDIDEVLDKLSPGEAVKLIAGDGPWHTSSIERLGIPAIKVGPYYADMFML
jgi:beta-glucosidase